MSELLEKDDLKKVNKPARYVGGEVNEVIKNRNNVKINVTLCYPDIYEKAMANYLIRFIYHNLNLNNDVYCTRCFACDTDFESLLLEQNIQIYNLEDEISIGKSDILLFILDNELTFTNFLSMLDLANIPFNKKDRDKSCPEILVFAANNINTKPIEMFVDNIIKYNANDNESMDKLFNHIMESAAVNVQDRNYGFEFPTSFIVPSMKIHNYTVIIDLSMINNIDNIIDIIEKSISLQGVTKVSFINENSVDIYKFCELIYRIKASVPNVKIMINNIDFTAINSDAIDVILPCVEKSQIAFNITTCSEKLLAKNNYELDKEKLYQNIKRVFKNNFNSLKLTFNIGLPNETYEDIDKIFDICQEIVDMYSQNKAKEKLSIEVDLEYYVPKKDEDFCHNINKLDTKVRYIKEKKCDSVVRLSIEPVDKYFVNIIVKNGEEDISDVLVQAYKLGARFDNDYTKYNENAWNKVIADNKLILKKYIKTNKE